MRTLALAAGAAVAGVAFGAITSVGAAHIIYNRARARTCHHVVTKSARLTVRHEREGRP